MTMSDIPQNQDKQDLTETSVSSEEIAGAGPESSELMTEANNNVHAKRGRMMTAGIVATIILAAVAILVAGIFQLTSRWTMVCPRDLPVNDPAPILWQTVVAEKSKSASLGVPEKVLSEAAFRGTSGAGSEEKPK
jgi:hypothetical protein